MPVRIPRLICKLIQRQTYSCLSTHYGIWFLFCGLCVIIVSAFHFGEVWLQWSASHYAGNFQFSRYYDNIVGKSFQSRLCLPQPIDIVYTWVNGSDPKLITKLNALKKELHEELNVTSRVSHRRPTKLINSNRFKWRSKTLCPLPNCVPAYKIALAGLPRNILKTELLKIHSNFSLAKDIAHWSDNIAFVSFEFREVIHHLLHFPLKYSSVLLNSSEVFYTSTIRSGHRKIQSTLMFYNLDDNSTVDEIKDEIDSQLQNSAPDVRLYHREKIGVLTFQNEDHCIQLKSMSSKRNFTINARVAKVLPVTYVWLPVTAVLDEGDEGISSNRFADNQELKYSLRSVEKFAPWIRRIFIVTNGQIPNWLNLNHPRITVVTHDEIFVNATHLPTFSSPAIESHIHRIHGLSNKFIYMNDDVFFGMPVWPDDFYTHSKGHKVFLSWAVPNCHEGCPASWVNDKYCDKACNVSACEWDGGDCLGDRANHKWSLQASYMQYSKTSGEYCSPGCAHNWIGDRYCDANCNTFLCGFDAGDCGLRNFDQLFSHSLESILVKGKNDHISAPAGTLAMYFNLTNIFQSIIEGNFQDSNILRTAVISKKFKILSVTFFKNVSESTVSFQILGYKEMNKTDKHVAVFKLNVTTIEIVKPTSESKSSDIMLNTTSTIKHPYKVYNYTYQGVERKREEVHLLHHHFSNISLPVDLAEKLKSYQKAFEDGEITAFGYNRSKAIIYERYKNGENSWRYGRKLLWADEVGNPLGKGALVKNKSDVSMLDEQLRDPYSTFFSFLPWEKTSFLTSYFDVHKRRDIVASYGITGKPKRHLMDAFSSSLLHVSRIYNKEFGYIARKVPAHMPHMVDREVIMEMQDKFHTYFDATSSHKIRHPEDMQFAFSFNYYLIGMKMKVNFSEVFDKVDSDNTGSLSEREQRSLAAMLYPLPLSLYKLKQMEDHLLNCSKRMNSSPLVTKQLFVNCHELWRSLNFTSEKSRYPHELQGEDDVIFKMIRNNASYVLHQLDWIRKNRKKFICLNDDLEHNKASSKMIRSILKDFYESLFPVRSQFELVPNYRNKFAYKWQLEEWQRSNRKRNEKVNTLLILFVLMLLLCIYRRKVLLLFKRLRRIFSGRGSRHVLGVGEGLVVVHGKEAEQQFNIL